MTKKGTKKLIKIIPNQNLCDKFVWERHHLCKVIVPMQENMSTESAMTLKFDQKPQNQIGVRWHK